MKYYFVILFSFASLILTAQDSGTVSGLISDKEFNNEPLAFANVLIKGSSKGTTSDFDGNYFLENMTPGVYTIQFSYVGYKTVEIETNVEAGKTNIIDVILQANSASLDEVVIKTTTTREFEPMIFLSPKGQNLW